MTGEITREGNKICNIQQLLSKVNKVYTIGLISAIKDV